jgi:GT2 family glycosyltransferase
VGAPSVAVVVPTHNRQDRLVRCLAALQGQEHPPDEIVVVDDGSEPPASATSNPTGGPPIEVLRNHAPCGPAAARNRGWRATSADYVLFTDDDCRPSAHWVKAMVAAARPGEILVGSTAPDPADGREQTPFDRTLHIESCDGSFPTCNVAYSRAALEELGGFDETFATAYGEDTDLGQRALTAGWKGVYVEDALVYHAVHRLSFHEAIVERRRLGELARLAALHPRLRDDLWDGHFWNGDHRLLCHAALAAAAAPVCLAGAARSGAGPRARIAHVAAFAATLLPAAEYLYFCRRRGRELGHDGWVANAAGWLALDAVEIAMLALGSLRYRSLLL